MPIESSSESRPERIVAQKIRKTPSQAVSFGALLIIYIGLLIAINLLSAPLTGKLLAEWFELWGIPIFASWLIAIALAGATWRLLEWRKARDKTRA